MAQPTISFSEPFPEPDAWIKQLVLLNDGKTAFITISKEIGVKTVIYDKSHKVIVEGISENKLWTDRKVTASTLKAVYNIDGQIVLFLTQLNSGNILSFHRLVISPESGKIVKAEELGKMPTRRANGFNLTNSNSFIVVSDYYISRDPVTSDYAVLAFEGYTADKKDRLKLSVYKSDHSVIKEALLDGKVNEAKFTHYGGMTMHDGDVFICTNEYEPRAKKEQAKVYLSVLRDKKGSFETELLNIKPFIGMSANDLVYNPASKRIQMMTHTETDTDIKWKVGSSTVTSFYISFLTYIDPVSMKVISSTPYKSVKANELAKKELGMPKGFNGVLPQMFISQKGETVLTASNYSSRQFESSGGTFKENMAITYFTSSDEEKEAYVLNIPALRTTILKEFPDGTVSLPYLSTPTRDYIIFNQDPNAVIYKLKNGVALKSFLFGKAEGKFSYKFISGPAVYDDKTNTMAVLMLENGKNGKQLQIAWVNFD